MSTAGIAGRVLNRFSKDLGFLDDLLPYQFYDYLFVSEGTICPVSCTQCPTHMYVQYSTIFMSVCTFLFVYHIRFNFRGVKLSWITNFRGFHVFIFAVCEILHKCCLSGLNFHGMKLSRMAIDPRKLRKFDPAKIKAYMVYCTTHPLPSLLSAYVRYLPVSLVLKIFLRFISIMVIAGIANYYIFIPIVLVLVVFLLLRAYYLTSAREIKRLEAIGEYGVQAR